MIARDVYGQRCARRSVFSGVLVLTLLLSLIVGWLPAAQAESPPSQRRFGVATNSNPLNYANYGALQTGWYQNWGSRPWGMQVLEDIEFYPMVGAFKDIYIVETEAELRSSISQCPECYPNGTIWIVANEPEFDYYSKKNGELIDTRLITTEEYAKKYHYYYHAIKAINPSYQVAIAATFGTFLYDTRRAYERLYGVKMPIDVYNVHCYMYVDGHNPDADILKQVKSQVSHKRQMMKDYGDRYKWLIITEIGALWNPGASVVTSFMTQAFDYLSTETSESLGCPTDGNRLVQRWAWYALTSVGGSDPERWRGTDLLDVHTGGITPVGQAYIDYPKGSLIMPCGFWGTVRQTDANVPAGTAITAWIGGTQYARTEALLYDGQSVYNIDLPADDPDTPQKEGGVAGDQVRFKIGGLWADEMGIWCEASAVNVDISTAGYCHPNTSWISAFGYVAGGWSSQDEYPRLLADVNADGRADIVAFAHRGVMVSLAQADNTFGARSYWIDTFGVGAGGWTSQDTYPRLLADVNADGRADIVAFAYRGVLVSLAQADNTFGARSYWTNTFGVGAGGWTSQDTYPRLLADVNADGRADIVAFGYSGVLVSLAQVGNSFGARSYWIGKYGPGAGGWTSQERYPRALADVNGDGLADIVGFGTHGTVVSTSTGSAFNDSELWLREFAVGQGWTSQNLYPRTLADMNGDGMADVVGFGAQGVFVALSHGTGFDAPVMWYAKYGLQAGGWSSYDRHPRMSADVSGDGCADVIGFGDNSVSVALTRDVVPESADTLATAPSGLAATAAVIEDMVSVPLPAVVKPGIDADPQAGAVLAGEEAVIPGDVATNAELVCEAIDGAIQVVPPPKRVHR